VLLCHQLLNQTLDNKCFKSLIGKSFYDSWVEIKFDVYLLVVVVRIKLSFTVYFQAFIRIEVCKKVKRVDNFVFKYFQENYQKCATFSFIENFSK